MHQNSARGGGTSLLDHNLTAKNPYLSASGNEADVENSLNCPLFPNNLTTVAPHSRAHADSEDSLLSAETGVNLESSAAAANSSVSSLSSTTTASATPSSSVSSSSATALSSEGDSAGNSAQAPSVVRSNFDFGFRVFRVDSSNFMPAYFTPEVFSQSLLSSLESNIKADRSDLDLLFACVLEGKLPLSCPYTELKLSGHKVYSYNRGDLLACFESNVGAELIRAIVELETQPLLLVLSDSCFAQSSNKINLSELCKTLLPNMRLKVL